MTRIDSDILWSYVLGELPSEEMSRIDTLRQSDSILDKEIDSLERSAERVAFDNKVKAPEYKDVFTGPDQKTAIRNKQRSINWRLFSGIAASLVIGFMIGGWFINQDLTKVQEEQIALNIELEKNKVQLEEQEKLISFLNHRDTEAYTLEKDQKKVVVYWNPTSKTAKLKTLNLPGLTSNETYQLWGDVDGVMKNLGTFDYSKSRDQIVDISYLERVESLNITIEPAGGSDHPNVSRLVMNKYI